MSCRKSCKKWSHRLYKSFKILFCAERNSGKVREGYIPSPEELVNVHLERPLLPSSLRMNFWSTA